LKLVIGAGGTGGHIIPAIAVGLQMSALKWEVTFIGNKDSMEEALVAKHKFRFLPIRVQKIYRKLTLEHLKFPFLFVKSLSQCLKYMSVMKPDAVFCTGSFVSGPVAIAAVLSKIPLYLQDGNSYPGLTTRLMAKYTRHIFIASDAARAFLPGASCLLVGNPILKYEKADLTKINWSEYNLIPVTKKLFVIGGSQGSVMINDAIGDCIKELLAMKIEIIWQTGKAHKHHLLEKYGNLNGVYIFDFTDKMSQFYQMSDFAISRAGALSIAELEEHRIPTIFIPLPTAAGNHQYKNAVAQRDKGVGMLLEQHSLNSKTLLNSVTKMLSNLQSFKDKLAQQPPNNATAIIAETIIREVLPKKELLC
jgi:UDP-N-acetylglucosamine--N-acetylmuramyl-(pentapeptide) pyrophosphoryl-undecaprenol N-acetylglucosamine transferase